MHDSLHLVRLATMLDASRLLEIARAAQDKLARSGSAQQLAGYSTENITRRIAHGELYVLDDRDTLLGSAFAEPVTKERFPQIGGWNVAPLDVPVWFLYGLVIDPARQGQGLGRVLLQGICRQETFAPPAVLTLDCWAGNQNLRRFYTDAGFLLHGEYPEDDYQIAVFRWTDSKETYPQPLPKGEGSRRR